MGLLDFNLPDLNSPEGQGLLAASLSLMQAKKMTGQKGAFGAALGQAGQQYMQTRQQATTQGDEREMRRMQLDGLKRKAAQEKATRDMLSRFQTPAQPGMGALQGDPAAGILPSAGREAKPAGFDYQGYAGALAGIDPMQALQLQKELRKETPKFSTAPQYDQQGNAFVLAENGEMKYLSGVKARDKLNEVRLGDKVGFRTDYSPDLQGSMPIGQSPDSLAGNAVTMRGQNMTDSRARERLSFDQSGGVAGKAPAGYRFTADGNMAAIPGGPADLKASQAGVSKGNDAREALAVIAEAEKLIPMSTGSGIGAIVDSAAGFFGVSPQGAQAGARLKALEGMLVSKMPKMSGPQSDKDVLLYKQMAGQVGDTALPVQTRMAALETIKGIQQQYGSAAPGGASGTWAAPAKPSGWSIQKAD